MNVPPDPQRLSKLNDPTQEGTAERRRTRDREKKRRQRATRKQKAAIEFVRTDASLFLDPDHLSQKAGAPKHLLRRMALKELVDNALDAAPTATLTEIDIDTFIVEDTGPGIDPAKITTMFSVTRPMISTKLIRRPTRGMVGNGNRVVAGAAFASGGSLVVESCGSRQELSFDRTTGDTIVTAKAASTIATGTRITIQFGPALPRDMQASIWGNTAIRLAGAAAMPMFTHPAWYSETSFHEVVSAARGTAQDLASMFGVDLCPAPREPLEAQPCAIKGDIDPDGPARSVTLDMLRQRAPTKAPRLIPLPEDSFGGKHKIIPANVNVAGANVPAIVQVWASEQNTNHRADTNVRLIVNRTPAVAELTIQPGGVSYFKGCGILWTNIGTVPKGSYSVIVAVTTPAVALISDGKAPDLTPFSDTLAEAIGTAMRRAHKPKRQGIKDNKAAHEVMEEAYLKASAGGTLPANARQIMYAARPHIQERTKKALSDSYFTQTLLPTFIAENPDLTADWDVVYDARGHLVEPHTDRSIPLGTLQVRSYLQRRRQHHDSLFAPLDGLHPTAGPGDRFGAVLFIEKEGFEPLLRAARIAERFDIAIMSTKGMSVIAARVLVDHLSVSGIKVLVAHDLDAAGLRIFGTLGNDSKRYQFSRPPAIRRLGLKLDQAVEMRLQSEQQVIKGDKDRVLEGLRTHGATEGELEFIGSGHRIELNAMPSDLFVDWLERELRAHGVAKVIPPTEVIEQRARQIIAIDHMRHVVHDMEREARVHAARTELPVDIVDRVHQQFQRDPSLPWESALAAAMEGQDVR